MFTSKKINRLDCKSKGLKKIGISFLIAISVILGSIYSNLLILENSFADGNIERVEDNAGILSESEVSSLKDKLNQISENQGMDVGIVTVNSLDGKSAQEYANDLFESSNFGKGDNKDGILLVVSIGDRKWAMSTHGTANNAFNSEGLDYISSDFLPYLSDSNYFIAFDSFANSSDELINMYNSGNTYGESENNSDEEYYEEYADSSKKDKSPKPSWIPISIVVGICISFAIMMMYKSQLKSVRKNNKADNYLMNMNLTKDYDIFLYRTVTRTMRPKNDTNDFDGNSGGGNGYGGSSGSF